MNERFEVTGMTCAACSARVEKAVGKLEGVSSVAVNLLTGSMQTDFDENITSADKIISAVEAAGYGASLRSEKTEKTREKAVAVDEAKEMLHRFVVSLCFLVPFWYL